MKNAEGAAPPSAFSDLHDSGCPGFPWRHARTQCELRASAPFPDALQSFQGDGSEGGPKPLRSASSEDAAAFRADARTLQEGGGDARIPP